MDNLCKLLLFRFTKRFKIRTMTYRHYPCFKRKSRCKRRHRNKTLIHSYHTFFLFNLLIQHIAKNTPVFIFIIPLCARKLFLYPFRRNRSSDNLSVRMYKRSAGLFPKVLEKHQGTSIRSLSDQCTDRDIPE